MHNASGYNKNPDRWIIPSSIEAFTEKHISQCQKLTNQIYFRWKLKRTKK